MQPVANMSNSFALIEYAVTYLENHPELPDVRYFLRDTKFALDWDPKRELQNDVDAYMHRMQQFGSDEARLLVWLAEGIKEPRSSPEELYMSYPVLMYIFMVQLPALVYWFRTIGGIFELAAQMPPAYRLVATGKCDCAEAVQFAMYRDWGRVQPILSISEWQDCSEDLQRAVLEVLPPARAMSVAQGTQLSDLRRSRSTHTWAPNQLASYCCQLADPQRLSGSPVAAHILWRYTVQEQRDFAACLRRSAGQAKEELDRAILDWPSEGNRYVHPLYVPEKVSQFAAQFRYAVTAEVEEGALDYIQFQILEPRFSYPNLSASFTEDFHMRSTLSTNYFAALYKGQQSTLLLFLSNAEVRELLENCPEDQALLFSEYRLMAGLDMFPSFRKMPLSARVAFFLYGEYKRRILEEDTIFSEKALICFKHLLKCHKESPLPFRFRRALMKPFLVHGKENPFFYVPDNLEEAEEIVSMYMEVKDMSGLERCAETYPLSAFCPVSLEKQLEDTQLESIHAILSPRVNNEQ